MPRRRQAAEHVEAEVRRSLPHLRLADPARFESKGLPAPWLCALHDREFRAAASTLLRPGSIGCPDCVEARAFGKRRQRLADADLDQHLRIIEDELDATHVEIYRLRCLGHKLADIATAVGYDEQRVSKRLQRIRAILAARGGV
jgi:hypothetical protein